MPTAKEELQSAIRSNDPGEINRALDRIREEKRAADEPAASKGIPLSGLPLPPGPFPFILNLLRDGKTAKSKGIPLLPPPVCATIAPSPEPETAADFPGRHRRPGVAETSPERQS